tara:strand:- start:28558 stop:28815 length:258 start_codon:yes stop_codon:yes gene_type:complete
VEKNDPRTWSYEDALNNFDEFCNYFDAASSSAAERTSRPTHPSGTAGDRINEIEKDATVLPSPERERTFEVDRGIESDLGEGFPE